MSFTLCTSGAIVAKAGQWASSTVTASGALLAQFCDQAEAVINLNGRYDFVTNYSSIKTNFQNALAEACSNLAACYVIAYDLGSYPNIQMATTQMDLLDDRAKQIIKLLQDKAYQDPALN